MKRRYFIAGLASTGALGSAGLVASGNVPEVLSNRDAPDSIEPLTIDTIDAPGSRDGEVTLPANDRPTFVDFFGTWCAPCIEWGSSRLVVGINDEATSSTHSPTVNTGA